jgi:hypothetical protein
MKTTRFILLALLSVSMVFLSSCKEDEEPDVSSFVGKWVMTKATISEAMTLTTNEIGDIEIPAGIDITIMMQDALLSGIDCAPESSVIELFEDFSIDIYCATSMETIDAGTWEEQSATVIVLNLNSTAVPSSPTGVVLTVIDVEIDGSTLTGTTSVPVAKEMLAGIVQLMTQGQATLNMDVTPDAVPMTFTIEFEKQ